MKWKKKSSNIIIAIILSIAFTIVTLLNIIGPLHINSAGAINNVGILSLYTIIYYICSLALIWAFYFYLRSKPQALFFTLICLGIVIIVVENFLWGWSGS